MRIENKKYTLILGEDNHQTKDVTLIERCVNCYLCYYVTYNNI